MAAVNHVSHSAALGVLVVGGLALALGCAGSATRTEQVTYEPAFLTTPPAALASGGAVKPGLTYAYKPLVSAATPGVSLNLALTSGPVNASFDGETLRWTPQLFQAGTSGTFTLSLSTNTGRTVTQTWTVHVGSRSAPSAVTMVPRSSGKPTEYHAFTWSIGFNDDDPGSVVVAASRPVGMLYDPGTRDMIWTPPGGSAGDKFVEIDVTNNVGQSTHLSTTINVLGNSAPTLASISAPNSANVGTTYVLAARIIDPNGDPLKATDLHATVTANNAPISPDPVISWDAINMVATASWPVPPAMEGQTVSVTLQATDPYGAKGTLSQAVSLTSKAGPQIAPLPLSPANAVQGSPVTVVFSVVASPGNTIDPASISSNVTDPYNQVIQPSPSVIWNAATMQASSTWTPPLASVGQTLNLNLRAAYVSGPVGIGSNTLVIDAQPVPTITPMAGAPSAAIVGYPVTVVFLVQPSPGRLIDTTTLKAKVTDSYGQAMSPAPTVAWSAATNQAAVTWVPDTSAKNQTATLTLSAANTGGGVGQGTQALAVSAPAPPS